MLGALTRRGCPLISTRLWEGPLQLRHVSESTAAETADYTCIKVGVDQDVGTITITRPKQLNALNTQACRISSCLTSSLQQGGRMWCKP